MVEVQFPFKEKLLEEVAQLTIDSKEFYDFYNAEGTSLKLGSVTPLYFAFGVSRLVELSRGSRSRYFG